MQSQGAATLSNAAGQSLKKSNVHSLSDDGATSRATAACSQKASTVTVTVTVTGCIRKSYEIAQQLGGGGRWYPRLAERHVAGP